MDGGPVCTIEADIHFTDKYIIQEPRSSAETPTRIVGSAKVAMGLKNE